MAKYRHIVFDVDGTLIDTRDCILYSLQEMLMTVKGERYEIEDLKFVLANTSVKNMHLLGVEEEKIPGAVEMWVANEEKNIDMIRIFDGIEELLEKLWNDKYYLDENVLLVNMSRLKKKMRDIGIVHLLENVRGKGWKL